MVDVAKVKLFGMDMGTFRWDESYNVARFEYDKNFADKGIEPSPIMMPVQQGRIYSFGNLNRDTFNGLPGIWPTPCRTHMAVPCSTDGSP